MAQRESGALRRSLGVLCVMLGTGMLLLSFSGIVAGCADHRAYADTEDASPAAPGPPAPSLPAQTGPVPPQSPAAPLPPVAPTPDPDAAVSSIEAGDGPAAPTAAQQPQPRASAAAAAAPAASPAPAGADVPAPAQPAGPAPAAGDGKDGFSALAEGWPASADNALDGDSLDAEQQLAPNTPLSDEARGFAGRWVAAVINKDGAARLLASEDEWVFNLGLDARCSARQKLNGRYWEQSGWWQLQGDTLTLSLGPGGVWVFGLQRQDADIAVWQRATEGTGGPQFTLFCVRTPEGRMPPGVAGRYNSDFGPLRFEPSGPGHWRASYGDPLGKLSVARVGGFLAGKWEQQPGLGFVLFRLNTAASTGQDKGGPGAASAIDGVWWYAGSTSFDGKWSATQAK